MECVELAPAFDGLGHPIAGASSTHSIRFATAHAQDFIAAFEQIEPSQSRTNGPQRILAVKIIVSLHHRPSSDIGVQPFKPNINDGGEKSSIMRGHLYGFSGGGGRREKLQTSNSRRAPSSKNVPALKSAG